MSISSLLRFYSTRADWPTSTSKSLIHFGIISMMLTSLVRTLKPNKVVQREGSIVEHTNRKQVLHVAKVCFCSFWIMFQCKRAALAWDNAYGQFLDRKRHRNRALIVFVSLVLLCSFNGLSRETDVGRGFTVPLSSLHLLIRLICSALVPGGSSLLFEVQ